MLEVLGLIKVVVVPYAAFLASNLVPEWSVTSGENPFATLVRRTPALVHLDFASHRRGQRPLATPTDLLAALLGRNEDISGLTGLAIDRRNLSLVLLALTQNSSALRSLSVFHAGDEAPTFVLETYQDKILEFPLLRSLASGLFVDPPHIWFHEYMASSWHFPLLDKIAIGSPPGHTIHPPGPSPIFLAEDGHPQSFSLRTLSLATVCFEFLGSSNVHELSFRVGTAKKEPEEAWFSDAVLAANFDKAPGGVVNTVETVVLVEEEIPLSSGAKRTLSLFVNRARFPSLKKVVWVSHKKDDDSTSWPAKWVLDLTKNGVEVDLQ